LQKLKFLFLQNNKYKIVLLFLTFTFPLFSIDLSKSNLNYFTAITDNGLDYCNYKEKLLNSVLFSDKAIRLQAALALIEKSKENYDYATVIYICRNLLDDGFKEKNLLENLFESYYSTKNYIGLSSAKDEFSAGIDSSFKIEYYNLLSALKLGNNSVEDTFFKLLIENPASGLITDAYHQITEAGISLSGSTVLLADFKSQLFNKNYAYAGRLMSKLLDIQKSIIKDTLGKNYIIGEVLLSPQVLKEMYQVSNVSGRLNELLSSIVEILSLPDKDGYEIGEVYSFEFISKLYETKGNIERKMNHLKDASESFYTGFHFSKGSSREKMIWYWYNSLFKYSPYKAVTSLETLTTLWTDSDYYNDILNEMVSFFVQKGDWENIRHVLDNIKFTGPFDSVSKYAYITARAGMLNYIPLDKTEINNYFLLSYKSGYGLASGLYYRILSGFYLNMSDKESFSWVFNKSISRNPQEITNGMDGSNKLVAGWIEFGLYHKAYIYLMENSFTNFSLVRQTAEKLLENGNYADSIRLVSHYSRYKGYNFSPADLFMVYPNAYKKEINLISEQEGIYNYVFKALVREESHFQKTVVSSAGAIGLSQLMPETAADVAGRLHSKIYNLKDAQTNLSFGGWYLGNLVRHTNVLIDALFAYNGGLTRVKRWRKTYSDLPDDLFLEAVPFKETSHYGRKVLVSSVIYGYLYDGFKPEEIINIFYRN